MSDLWCVLVNTGTDFVAYGPMDAVEAEGFAAFMTSTVDPATPRPLRSPTREMLGWWQSELDRNNCTHATGCEVHPLHCPPAPGMPVCTGDGDCPAHPEGKNPGPDPDWAEVQIPGVTPGLLPTGFISQQGKAS